MSMLSSRLSVTLAVAGLAASAAHAQDYSNTLGDPGFEGSYVASFETFDDGSGELLYATGQFTVPGVSDGENLVRWNGSAWEGVGGLQDQYSNTLETFQGDLIAGGYFNSAGNEPDTAKLARWDGSQWHSMDAQLESFLSSVWDLAVYDSGDGDELIIAGNYVDLNGVAGLDHIARWDGSSYSELSGTIGGAVPLVVLDVETADLGSGEKLYAGGRFLNIDGMPALNIAEWDGQSWSDVNIGLSRTSGITQVFSMTTYDDGNGEDLYVGGSFTQAGGNTVSPNIARWDGSSWSSVGDGFDGSVRDLIVFDDGSGESLYALGTFENSGGTGVSRIARWNGSSWEPVGAGANADIFGGFVYDYGEGNALVMGGGFTTLDGNAASFAGALLADGDCPADLTGPNGEPDGQVTSEDFLAYIDLFAAGDPQADFTGDGQVTSADFLAYIDAFAQGCP